MEPYRAEEQQSGSGAATCTYMIVVCTALCAAIHSIKPKAKHKREKQANTVPRRFRERLV